MREKVARRPLIFGRSVMLVLYSIPTFILHFNLLLSCLLYSPKTSKVKQNPFILFPKFFLFIYFDFLDFILCNDEINMLLKRSK
jgi:hypothetical protein